MSVNRSLKMSNRIAARSHPIVAQRPVTQTLRAAYSGYVFGHISERRGQRMAIRGQPMQFDHAR